MNAINNVKVKLSAVADKLQNSKVYKACEKGAVTVGAMATSVGIMATNAFAAESEVGSVILAEINSGDVLSNAMPFINIGLPVLVVVGGIRLGMRFLRGCMH